MYNEETINKFKDIQELMLYPQWAVFKKHIADMLGDILRKCGSATKDTIDELRGRRIAIEEIYRLEDFTKSILDTAKKQEDSNK